MGNENGLRGTPRYIYVAFVLIICTRYYVFYDCFKVVVSRNAYVLKAVVMD